MWRVSKMNERIQRVKKKLLELGYLDNIWLDKYLELIEINLGTPRNRQSTQAHHAIPVNSYWVSDEPYDRKEALKLAAADAVNFEVNLLYRDHLLIHSYLTLCTDLDRVQQRYEAQSELRKRNSQIGAAATNKKLGRQLSGKHKTAEIEYLQQFFSSDEASEISNL